MNLAELRARGWPCPTGDEMRRVDADAIQRRGIPGRMLMETAGRAVAEAVCSAFPATRRPLVVCGGGNNGGDGFVVARVLREWNTECRPLVISLADPVRQSPEARQNLDQLLNSSVEVAVSPNEKDVAALALGCDLIVDAVFGVGLSRPVSGPAADVLRVLGAAGLPVVAIDLPSGLSSETGATLGTALEADLIVTLGLPKLGLAVRRLRADIRVADIGLPALSIEQAGIRQHLLTACAAAALLPPRPLEGHKGSFGHVLVVGGSEGKTGAAVLAAEGALRAGAGLVTAAVPRSLNPILEVKLTEAMTLALEDSGTGAFSEGAASVLLAEAGARDALVLGPGIGRMAGAVRAVERVLSEYGGPAVVDADGLNAFEARPEDLRGPGPRVLTPHPGEAARLLSTGSAEVQGDRIGAARELALRTDAVVLLKGARSLSADPSGQVWINPTGGPGLATGGTGDVLAGVVGALLAAGLAPLDAARLGAYLHGLAGELGPDAGGLAGEVASRIPAARERLVQAGRAEEGRGNDESGTLCPFP